MKWGVSREEFLKTAADEATALASGYELTGTDLLQLVPVTLDSSRTNVGICVARVFPFRKGSSTVHNVVIGYNPIEQEFIWWCGDKFLESSSSSGDRTGRRDRALAYLSEKGVALAPGAELSPGGAYLPSAGCNFYKSGKNMCKHCRGAFQLIKDDPSVGLVQFSDSLIFAADQMVVVDGEPATASGASAEDPVFSRLNRYAFEKNLIIEGDKGWGKTWMIGRYCADSDVDETVIIGGHEGLESVDLVGHMIRVADGSMAWKDGKLAQAFRLASMGLRVVLVIDEILRIRRRELSVLVAALARHSDGMLRLGTGRPVAIKDGLACEEVLACAPANLWVVCTTNVGAGYDVEDMEEALSDRFPIILRVEGGEAGLRQKLGSVISSKQFSSSALEKFVGMWKEFNRFRVAGEVTRQMNLRHLCEIVEMAKSEAEFVELAFDRIPQWVERDGDGKMITGQYALVERLIRTKLGGAR